MAKRPSVYVVPEHDKDLHIKLVSMMSANVLRPGDILEVPADGKPPYTVRRTFENGDAEDVYEVLPYLIHASGPRIKHLRREK